jgi:hypothetical protein
MERLMKLKLMTVLGVLALGACNTTQTAAPQAGDVVYTAEGKPKKLTAREAHRMRCVQKQQNAANVAMGASVVGAGANVVSAAAVPHWGGWGWGYGGSYGTHVAGAAVGGVSQVVAQSATNEQIEAAMGNC